MGKITKICTLICILGGLMLTSCNEQKTTGDGISSTPNNIMDKTFYNPLDISKGIGDPWLYKHNDGNYYYCHSASGVVKVTKTSSPTSLIEDIGDETRTKIIFRQKSIDRVEIWAPEVFFFKGNWYAYFTAAKDLSVQIEKDESRRTYGMKSKTDDIFGEWEDAKEISLPDDYRSIDATFFSYKDKQYIVYSGWPNSYNLNYRQNLYIQELEKDNPLVVSSSETSRHLISEPTNSWEIDGGTAQNEGPAVSFAPDGTPIIFYSGSYSGGDNYCICYLKLTGENLLEQNCWTKCSEPLMQTDMSYSEIIAPGHNSIFKSPDGTEDWICYHSAKKSGSGWDRQVRLQKMTWNGNTPIVEKIDKASDEVVLPSGDKVKRYKFEAENADLTDDCYIIEQDGFASNNKTISISKSGQIQFNIAVPSNGKYAIGIRYSNRDSNDTTLKAIVNNSESTLIAPNTQYDDNYFMTWFYTDMYIKPEGENNVVIKCDSSIYIDCLVLDYLNH